MSVSIGYFGLERDQIVAAVVSALESAEVGLAVAPGFDAPVGSGAAAVVGCLAAAVGALAAGQGAPVGNATNQLGLGSSR